MRIHTKVMIYGEISVGIKICSGSKSTAIGDGSDLSL